MASRWLRAFSSKQFFSTTLSTTILKKKNVIVDSSTFPLSWNNTEAKTVGSWLLGTAGVVVGMIHVGGLTRLTSSGLSMTTWSPLGTLPPLSLDEWREEFARYQQFPEYQQRQTMTLSEFQYIYAWEYGHRMLGRFVGIVYVVPWMVLSYRGMIQKVAVSQSRLLLLGGMGATQGLVGWWMVKSGLGDNRRSDQNQIKVKPIRLMTHLSMAMATYGTLCWTAWDVLRAPSTTVESVQKLLLQNNNTNTLAQLRNVRQGSLVVAGLTALSIVTGALVAGNDAGRAYNSWPKMTDEEWIAPEVWSSSSNNNKKATPSWQHYVCDDTATTQFHHRLLGQVTGVTALSVVAYGLLTRRVPVVQIRQGLMAMGLATTAQVTLGITTLLYHVPISLAALHQLGSVVVLTSSLYTLHVCQSVLKHSSVRKAIQQVAAAKQVPR
mmetsp:Transcript_28436/g.42031  ORF Transcript_28436/g.42031 Transcript_28436/m.42031 type:complete len:436 (+) Transcript_28436:90-1397(+)|eukprot:CAMPEP_0194219094 /NCGR_PEP_ID=MMETSP0156-20130528/25188_1 /TAXON_ID=33649 /ORGANISM="Thalassionema nitzschioides, Strain L26-B" /LENGTH=435 /DNA_ID=CAMNT_0038948649 /DNA_START=29 /DNA_END=1336 /DNA_ORIENTATION=+